MIEFTTVFKALSDKTRLKIMWLLNNIDSKATVSEIIDVVGESQYNVSRHLQLLKSAGLVSEAKDGRWVFYSLLPAKSEFQKSIKAAVLSIPQELMKEEIKKCHEKISMRQNNKDIIADKNNWKKTFVKLQINQKEAKNAK
jgi:ArsR family transcriptional regulator